MLPNRSWGVLVGAIDIWTWSKSLTISAASSLPRSLDLLKTEQDSREDGQTTLTREVGRFVTFF